jgi:hypothetical protein
MPGQQIIDKVANNRVWFVAQLGHDTTDQRRAARVPLEIDRAMNIAGAMNFCPTMRSTGLLSPHLDEAELFLELRIAHDFVPQRSTPGRDYLNHCLHLLVGTPRRGVRGQRSALFLPFARI